jgi:CRISPR system Cascade subunit CasA
MAFNLLSEAWVPVRRSSGARPFIRPAQVTEAHDSDPVIALDWARPDFRIAGLEFLIGLLSTACPPTGHHAWIEGWEEPPDPATLDAAFAPFLHAFNLDGDGPRFLQDREDLVSDAEPIERLLIDAPGASTVRQNTDLLVRRGRAASLGRPAAAMALYTFQAWAPAGGAGNRTGLRGGGPMVTLAMPAGRPSIWRSLWANVPIRRDGPPKPEDLPRIFPWLAPTITSEGSRTVTPEDAHPLQCWWGMPRRIRLDFAPAPEGWNCNLTAEPDTVKVTSWRQRPRGANYALWGGVHPLAPHYRQKPDSELLPLHPQPGGVGYRHWLGLVMRHPDGLRLPAGAITTWRDQRERMAAGGTARLLAAGYDMDNMKARAFIEAEMPLPAAPDEATRGAINDLATRLVLSANLVAGLLRSAVRSALFSQGATVKLDTELLSSMRERLWDETEVAFFDLLTRRPDTARETWCAKLRETALRLFDEAAPLTPENGVSAAPRIGRARRNLVFALTGHGKDGTALAETLGLVAPVPKARKARGKAS